MLKQLERLKIIYNFLLFNKVDSNKILNHLKSTNASISLRQLQRDLIDIEKYYISNTEKLIHSVGKQQKKYWEIQTNLDDQIISKSKLAINTKKKKKRKESSIYKTNFYLTMSSKNNDEILFKLEDALSNCKLIQINELKNDITVDNYFFKLNKFEFAPISIVNHRGALHISGINYKSKEVLIYEIGQLHKFEIIDKKYNYNEIDKNVKLELDKRFGITKNINDETYNIVLEFASATGALVSKYFWHHSQVFEKSNGNVIMKMKCGINRELLGWLFQWMYNVRIVEPPLLIEIYKKSLIEIINNQRMKKPLVYRNIFEPTKFENNP
jgi:hypothetical protein